MDEDLLNAPQAAAYLGITKQRIYELANNGRIGRKIGGYWLFSRAELDDYNKQRAERPDGGRPAKITNAPALP